MTDLEIVKKCAEAMGHDVSVDIRGNVFFRTDGTKQPYPMDYDPLHDDAQAMALVQRFRLMIWTESVYWLVADSDCEDRFRTMNQDLNRAICECVAKMEIK